MKARRGVRFAPSPTGRLHIGNLRTAWVSYQIARALKEPWHVRFEDIDKIRVLPGAAEKQLDDMRRLGLEPDEVIYQSRREDRHWELFSRGILENAKIYPCYCSAKGVRRELQGLSSAPNSGEESPVYTGRCRNLNEPLEHHFPSVGWRFRSLEPSGRGDFLVARSGPDARPGVLPDRLAFASAYHWACAIDDLDGGYSVIVRAWDLKPAAAIQREIQKWIDPNEGVPAVYHTSLVVADDGARLEKRTRGVTLDELESQGVTAGDLVRFFEKSFRFSAADISPGAIAGEALHELRLDRLNPVRTL